MNKSNKKIRPWNTTPTLEEIFSCCETMPNGCIEWRKSVDAWGYGRITISNKGYTVSRLVLTLIEGEPKPNQLALHSCDNPPCVNPEHLRWGTQKQNVADAMSRGRMKLPDNAGAKHGAAKLSESDIPQIFAMLGEGKRQWQIAKVFGIHQSIISEIKNGKRWVKESAPYRQMEGK